ncbi:MAG: tripartite tricarboxylate transporter substrate binding protein [Betaproteobacteria bacterium]|nr:tripartite tricarboxylate transporter substrate binding protein [Betaproteobacteria bacterium]
MRITAGRFIAFVFCTAAGTVLSQSYPNKPIRLVVGYAPGGGTDTLARMVGVRLESAWGKPVVIENRAGAGGIIATEMVKQSPPDGYTLIVGGASAMTVNPVLYAKLSYDPLKDFIPITNLAQYPLFILVHPSLPVRSVKELIAYAKANPGKLNYASSNPMVQLATEMFNQMAGTKMTHVPYKGGAPSVTAVLSGEAQLTFVDSSPSVPQIKAGRLIGLATTSPRRTTALPDLPTIAEAGVSGYELVTWFGLFAPAGVPGEVISKINAEVVRIVNSPEFSERLVSLGGEPAAGSSEEFVVQIRREIARYGVIAKAGNIKAD